jgi:hypothetical protein
MTVMFPPREPPAAPKEPAPSSGLGKAGDVCGLLGLLITLLLSVGLGVVLCILGIVFGAVGKSKTGVAFGIIGLVAAAVVIQSVMS